MIGLRAMGLMLFPIFGLVLLAILLVSAMRARATWPPFKRLAVIVICALGAAYLVLVIGFHVSDFSRIRNLRQEDLAQVRIGEHVLTSPQDIAAVCSALTKTEWLESQHGGWAEELPLTFKTRTGREYSYRVAYYRAHPGAVILHRVGGPGGYMLGDVGFNAHLPDALSRMGISLPQAVLD